MEPRSFTCLLQVDERSRCDLIAEGLEHISEHVETLRDDVTRLAKLGRGRSATILSLIAEEEAAKALMLLDVFRVPADRKLLARQLRRISSHLARRVYAYAACRRQVSFGDLRDHVDRVRRSHDLDGPTGTDWIITNELLAEREQAIYVDFIWDRERAIGSWMTPALFDGVGSGSHVTAVPDLVLSLRRMGCLSRPGLDVIADTWKGVDLPDDTDCFQLQDRNVDVLNTAYDQALFLESATDDDVSRVVDHWGFPMVGLDLGELEVTPAALREQQQQIALQGAAEPAGV